MVIGQRQVHHRTQDDLSVHAHGPLLDGVHAQDGTLGRIDDGRGQHRPVDAPVADREGAPLHLVRLEFAGLSARTEIGNGLFNLGEAHAVRIAQHGNHEALAAADGNADVEVMLVDDVRAPDLGIDRGKGPKGIDKITILYDRDEKGLFRKSKDFITGLNLASGMAWGHGGLFVANPPYLLFYPDKNEDDIPDGDPEVLLEGFGMEDSHAYVNSLQWGPDGWLYGRHGIVDTSYPGTPGTPRA